MLYQIIRHEHIFEPLRFFDQCHASTLCRLPDGTFVCAWFAGTKEGAEDCAVWMSRETGEGWSKPEKVAQEEGEPCWNPVLFYNGERLLLFYKAGKTIPAWRTLVKESLDGGRTWGEKRELVAGDKGGRGPVKNKCLRLKSGRILAPASVETETEWSCFTDCSEDGGQNWTAGEKVLIDRSGLNELGVIQPSLWEDAEGNVRMLMRSTEGFLFESVSRDGGKSWEAAKKTALPNNNCGIDLVKTAGGRLVLVCNPVSQNWGPRSPIAFLVSEDDGKSWTEPVILEHVPCEKNEIRAEFSYPAVIADGEDIYITYTWKRQSIAFWHIRFLQ